MKNLTLSLSSLILVGVALVGCMATSTTASAQKDKAPNDFEIAHIAYTAGNIDIRYAQLALALSDDPKVREFAELMVRDHTAVNNKALTLTSRLHIIPQDNATSQQLSERAKEIRNELSNLRGAAFDKRYVANELEYHKFVNGALENGLIPNATNAELKTLLTSALQTFKVHEGHVASMNQRLM